MRHQELQYRSTCTRGVAVAATLIATRIAATNIAVAATLALAQPGVHIHEQGLAGEGDPGV